MNILYIYDDWCSFTINDFEILKSEHEVKGILVAGGLLKTIQTLPALWRGVVWCDVTFSWFGKLHAFFAVLFSKILGKKSIVVAGGDDVACIPEIKYGMFCFWRKKWCPLFVFHFADMILSVSEFTRNSTLRNAHSDPGKTKTVYHGFDPEKWKRNKNINKENIVITVGSITEETLYIKSLLLFVQCAKLLPDIQFFVVGPYEKKALDALKGIAAPNVKFLGALHGDGLIRMYSRAKVYVQASLHESFGCSLAEAMLCECVPVVSNKAALPEVVGDTGVYLDELTAENIAGKIKYALTLSADHGARARNRIIEKYPLEQRRQKILDVMSKIENI